MKKGIKISIQLLILVLLFSCSSSDDNPTPGNVSDLSDAVSSGTWRITYYWDNDKEETNHFTGYNFTFGGNGTLSATSGTNTYNGTWSTGTDDSQVKLIINFSSPADFVDISDDWHVIELTNSKIRLEDVSGGNGGTDLLTIEKN